jgi:hypothetical protein
MHDCRRYLYVRKKRMNKQNKTRSFLQVHTRQIISLKMNDFYVLEKQTKKKYVGEKNP